MQKNIEVLWRHLDVDCSGWVGVQMWSDRWRSAVHNGEELLELHKKMVNEIKSAIDDNNSGESLEANARQIQAQRKQVIKAISRANDSLKDVLKAQQSRMLAEINCLNSKSSILEYLSSGYWESANNSLNAVQEESKTQNELIKSLCWGGRSLRLISLDRKLLGLDSASRTKAENEVSGFFYGLKSIWDFFLGSLAELNEDNRAAAREVLRSQVRATFDLISGVYENWSSVAELVLKQELNNLKEREDSIRDRRDDFVRYKDGLKRKLNFLANSEPKIFELAKQVQDYEGFLRETQGRIAASCRNDFEVFLIADSGRFVLKKAREHGLMLLFAPFPKNWRSLILRWGVEEVHLVPLIQHFGSTTVRFVGKDNENHAAFTPPADANRLELQLSSLKGVFKFKRKTNLLS
jgi:hypothetical protein